VVLAGRTAVVVDDGIATGATVRVALQALARSGAARRIVLAVPVVPRATAEALRALCDEAVFLAEPVILGSVGAFYDDFRQTDDAEVIALLNRTAARASPAASPVSQGARKAGSTP
jgi:putative phosphoribosyl transferase